MTDEKSQYRKSAYIGIPNNPPLKKRYFKGESMEGEDREENLEQGYSKIIEDFEARIKADPKDAESRFILGSIYEEGDDVSKAEQMYREVIQMCPEHSVAHFSLAKVLGKIDKLEEALVACKEAVRLNSEEPEFHLLLAAIYDGMEKLGEAAEACEKAVKLDPEDAEANFGLGSIYAKLDRIEPAIQKYQDAIKLEPDYLEAHHNLALAYDANQDGFKAILHLRIAKALMEEEMDSKEAILEVEEYINELYEEYGYEPKDFEDSSNETPTQN